MSHFICPNCQQANHCQFDPQNQASAKNCWCMQQPLRKLPKAGSAQSCYCSQCLRQFPLAPKQPPAADVQIQEKL